MNKKIKFTLLFTMIFAFFGVKLNAQLQSGALVDGIAVVVDAGRLGSMTFIILLTRRKPPAPVQYPTDKVIIG